MIRSTDFEKRKRIIDGSMELFYKFNYSRVTSDEIASHIGVSKKTIYNYFTSKRDILVAGISELKNDLDFELDKILSRKDMKFTDKLKLNLTTIALKLNKITPNFGEDLRKNLPDIWEEISKYKKEAAIGRFRKLLKTGKRDGYINNHVDLNMAMLVYMSALNNLLDPLFLNNLPHDVLGKVPYSAKEIFNLLVNVIFLGVLTEEGKEEFLNI
jgi:AcrR family transcriptional regulator